MRDSQRSRVYTWERAAAKLEQRDFYEPEFRTLEECEEFMNPIWRKERGRVGQARVRAPELSRQLWGQRRATAGSDHVIKLPLWARSRWVILHEMAHRLTPGAQHGPRFVGALIGLAARWLDCDANHLMLLADEHGVKYHVRTIGVVPVRGPAWYVECDLEDATPLKDYLEPQFRAASDSDASVTYRLHFEPPLPVNEKAQEALVQRLTRLVSPVAHVLAVVAEKKS